MLLLNTVLTVRAHQANSHAKKVPDMQRVSTASSNESVTASVGLSRYVPVESLRRDSHLAHHLTVSGQVATYRMPYTVTASQGWEAFTDAAIAALSKRRSHVVFLLWGKPAQTKEKLINQVSYPLTRRPHLAPCSVPTSKLMYFRR